MAETADIPQLANMRIAFVKCDQGTISEADLSAMRKRLPIYFQTHLNKDLIAFIAKDDDRIVATTFLLVVDKPPNPHFINGRVGEVLNVYTSENYRRNGIAFALIKDLLYKRLGFQDSVSPYIAMRYEINFLEGMT